MTYQIWTPPISRRHKEAPLYNIIQGNGWGSGLPTCKESGLFLKSMSSQNISSFGHHFRRLAPLNSNHITDVTQPLVIFTSERVCLKQLSKNWGKEETLDMEDNHTQAPTPQEWVVIRVMGKQTKGEQTGGEEGHTLHHTQTGKNRSGTLLGPLFL